VHQTYASMRALSTIFTNPELRIGAYFGGTHVHESSKDLKDDDKAPHIIISTVGRLRHLFEGKYIEGYQVEYFVIDECDKIMACEDSRKDLYEVLGQVNKKRQLMMFTATLNKSTKEECLKIMKEGGKILELEKDQPALPNLRHYFVVIE